MQQAEFLDRPSVLSLCSLCSATWEAETGPTEEWLFSPFCRDNKKVAALCEKYFCSSLLETELFIGLTAHHCGLGLTRYSNLSVSRVGGVVWYIKYLCNLFLFFLALNLSMTVSCSGNYTHSDCAWLRYSHIFEASKLYLRHKSRLNKWLGIFVPLSQPFMAVFSTFIIKVYLWNYFSSL